MGELNSGEQLPENVVRSTAALLGCGIPDDWIGDKSAALARDVLGMALVSPTPASDLLSRGRPPLPRFAVSPADGVLTEVTVQAPGAGTLADILASYGEPDFATLRGPIRFLQIAYPARGRTFAVGLPPGDGQNALPYFEWTIEPHWEIEATTCFKPNTDALVGTGVFRGWDPASVYPWPGLGARLGPSFGEMPRQTQ